jgi:hypothetical protein
MITRGEMPQVRRVCVLAWGGAAVSWELSTPGRLGAGLASCAAFLLLATGCALRIRHVLLAELRRMREIAGAAQRALLRPPPGRIQGLTLAAAQLSASRGAVVGGDLYEAVPTGYGVRVVIGDVRGHGLPALGAAAAVLGAFREAAYVDPAAAPRHRPASRACEARGPGRGARSARGAGSGRGGVRKSSAQRPTDVRTFEGGETLPPLGVVPVPDGLAGDDCGQLWPGEVLFLYTDGAEDARDAAGRFFPLRSVLAERPADTPARLVAGVHAELLRHTGGQLADDVALLVLRSDRNP